MLELRPNCECCDRDLPPGSLEARICTFECTFCAACTDNVLHGRCPNCTGELVHPGEAPVHVRVVDTHGFAGRARNP